MYAYNYKYLVSLKVFKVLVEKIWSYMGVVTNS